MLVDFDSHTGPIFSAGFKKQNKKKHRQQEYRHTTELLQKGFMMPTEHKNTSR